MHIMPDVHNHNKATRSYNMSRIRGKDTKPEMLVRRVLHANGFRYRLHAKNLPGKPDLVLPKYKRVIFVHGCFWHGHEGCTKSTLPQTRTEWWRAKIEKNKSNDQRACDALSKADWKTEIVLECQLKSTNIEETLSSPQKGINRFYYSFVPFLLSTSDIGSSCACTRITTVDCIL